MSTISFSECLEIINRKDKLGNPVAFTLDFFTLNRNSKKGGLIKRYKNAKLLAFKKGLNNLNSLTIQANAKDRYERNPKHFLNRTRNIELENGSIKKIHIRLIDSINGKKVLA